jgi:hypothetical protein
MLIVTCNFFDVIGGGKFRMHFFFKCELLPSFFQNGSKEFDNLRLLDLTKASPNILKNFIQGQDFHNL